MPAAASTPPTRSTARQSPLPHRPEARPPPRNWATAQFPHVTDRRTTTQHARPCPELGHSPVSVVTDCRTTTQLRPAWASRTPRPARNWATAQFPHVTDRRTTTQLRPAWASRTPRPARNWATAQFPRQLARDTGQDRERRALCTSLTPTTATVTTAIRLQPPAVTGSIWSTSWVASQ